MSAERVIWKYDISCLGRGFSLLMPAGAQLLTAQIQNRQAVLWALVDPDADRQARSFALEATGCPLPVADRRYIATLQDGLGLVWHLFEYPAEQFAPIETEEWS